MVRAGGGRLSRGAKSTLLIRSATVGRGRTQALGPALPTHEGAGLAPHNPLGGVGSARSRWGMQAGKQQVGRRSTPGTYFPGAEKQGTLQSGPPNVLLDGPCCPCSSSLLPVALPQCLGNCGGIEKGREERNRTWGEGGHPCISSERGGKMKEDQRGGGDKPAARQGLHLHSASQPEQPTHSWAPLDQQGPALTPCCVPP